MYVVWLLCISLFWPSMIFYLLEESEGVGKGVNPLGEQRGEGRLLGLRLLLRRLMRCARRSEYE